MPAVPVAGTHQPPEGLQLLVLLGRQQRLQLRERLLAELLALGPQLLEVGLRPGGLLLLPERLHLLALRLQHLLLRCCPELLAGGDELEGGVCADATPAASRRASIETVNRMGVSEEVEDDGILNALRLGRCTRLSGRPVINCEHV